MDTTYGHGYYVIEGCGLLQGTMDNDSSAELDQQINFLKLIGATKLWHEIVSQAKAQVKKLKPANQCEGDDVLVVYPPGGKNRVSVLNLDLALLKPGQQLNDTIIDFALQ